MNADADSLGAQKQSNIDALPAGEQKTDAQLKPGSKPNEESGLRSEIPEFVAYPLLSPEDSTVFLHKESGAPPFFSDLGNSLTGSFASLHTVLEQSVKVDGQIDKNGLQQLSAAGDVRLKMGKLAGNYTARGLVCFAERRRSISVTLRSVKPKVPDKRESFPPSWFNKEWLRWNFEPSSSREPQLTGGKPYWFSLDDQSQVLSRCIFGKADQIRARPAQGLVVLTGGTNSAKSDIARGLIHLYLQARLGPPRPPRQPHLVTFEDPIESFFVVPTKEDLILPPVGGDLDRILGKDDKVDRKQILCSYLDELPKTLLAQLMGIDYTPREKGQDVRDLSQAFADALRQTPSVFFIGEIRNPKDWVDVLEFAGTGHLVVATAHAGSLVEAMVKILSAVKAKTPADRRRYASRLRAVVHLLPRLADDTSEVRSRNLLLPAVWRNSQRGLAALSADGLGAIVPECPKDEEADHVSALGRRWFVDQLVTTRRRSLIAECRCLIKNLRKAQDDKRLALSEKRLKLKEEKQTIKAVKTKLHNFAAKLDLRGE